jgi:hypothetical protein
MDFRIDPLRGGSDGCVNFNDPTNSGLLQCIQRFDLPAVYANHCDIVSLADFIIIASEALMARTHHTYNPDILWGSGSVAKNFRD